MSVSRRMVLVCVCALCPIAAQGDFVSVTAARVADASSTDHCAVRASGFCDSGWVEADWLQPKRTDSADPAHPSIDLRNDPATEAAKFDLPPAPSSYALGLSALASLGVVQAGRSLRRFHLGAIPEWYHAGGPTQIGHRKVLALELGWSAALHPLTEGAFPLRWCAGRDRCPTSRLIFHSRSPVAACPRGPPDR